MRGLSNRWAFGLGLALVGGLVLGACGLDPKECASLRSQAFEIINEAHTCDSDADCIGSDWPGCAKPVSTKNLERIRQHHAKFTQGKCEEPKRDCRLPPEVYCKQGLCVFREQAPGR